MNFSRRSFLRGALVVTAGSIIQPVPIILPIIYGDGRHDDWDGLQAMFDGLPFRVENDQIVARDGVLANGMFRISRTLELGRGGSFTLFNTVIEMRPDFADDAVIFIVPPKS